MTVHPEKDQPTARRRQGTVVAEDDEAIAGLARPRAAAQGCRRCPLYKYATQAMFGEGPKRAEVMFVGEQPGDKEDLAGKPFVGPAAGRVLDAAVEQVGIYRARVYITNAVKHFKFTPPAALPGGDIEALWCLTPRCAKLS